MMKNTTAACLLTLTCAASLSAAEPTVYSNFNLGYDIGIFLPEFLFDSQAAPLDITIPASSQAPLDFLGGIPDEEIALQYRAAQTSSDIGWYAIGGDTSFGSMSRVSIIDGITVTVHHLSDPDTTSDFTTPAILNPGDAVAPGQNNSTLLYISSSPTIEGGFDDYWFVPYRFIVGVAIELDDGTHYGFIEFEDVRSFATPTIRDYQPVRWGYETTPDVPFIIPTDCGVADTNRDNTLDFFDVSIFLNAYANTRYAADLNFDGTINFFDISIFLAQFTAGCN